MLHGCRSSNRFLFPIIVLTLLWSLPVHAVDYMVPIIMDRHGNVSPNPGAPADATTVTASNGQGEDWGAVKTEENPLVFPSLHIVTYSTDTPVDQGIPYDAYAVSAYGEGGPSPFRAERR